MMIIIMGIIPIKKGIIPIVIIMMIIMVMLIIVYNSRPNHGPRLRVTEGLTQADSEL